MYLINIESLTNTRGLSFRRYILQGEYIVIVIFIFRIISKKRERKEERREEGSSK